MLTRSRMQCNSHHTPPDACPRFHRLLVEITKRNTSVLAGIFELAPGEGSDGRLCVPSTLYNLFDLLNICSLGTCFFALSVSDNQSLARFPPGAISLPRGTLAFDLRVTVTALRLSDGKALALCVQAEIADVAEE